MAKFNLYSTLENDLDIDSLNKTVSVVPQLAPKEYAKVKDVLTRLGGSWNTRRQCFNFSKDPDALIQRALSTGTKSLNKYHFYPTPSTVFEFIERHTSLSFLGAADRTIKALEPSCGDGSLYRQLENFGQREGREFVIDGYDIDELNVIFCEESGLNVKQADFLSLEPNPCYDLVLMNPPFNGREFIKHIRHAQKFLDDDGVLLAVVPTQWIEQCDANADYAWLMEMAQIKSGSALDSGDWFEPGVFDGVSISTTVIELPSISSAEKILNSEKYLNSAIQQFIDSFFSTHKYAKRSEKELGNAELCFDEALKLALNVVDRFLNDKNEDTSFIVRQFKDSYALTLLENHYPKGLIDPRATCEMTQCEFDLIAA